MSFDDQKLKLTFEGSNKDATALIAALQGRNGNENIERMIRAAVRAELSYYFRNLENELKQDKKEILTSNEDRRVNREATPISQT